MDQTILKSCNRGEVLKCIIVGLLCVQEDPGDRPNMSNVVFMLGSETATLPNPKEPAFVAKKWSTTPTGQVRLNTGQQHSPFFDRCYRRRLCAWPSAYTYLTESFVISLCGSVSHLHQNTFSVAPKIRQPHVLIPYHRRSVLHTKNGANVSQRSAKQEKPSFFFWPDPPR